MVFSTLGLSTVVESTQKTPTCLNGVYPRVVPHLSKISELIVAWTQAFSMSSLKLVFSIGQMKTSDDI